MFCWLEVLVPEEYISPRRHNNDCVELEVKYAIWPFCIPHASDSTGKGGSHCAGWVIEPDYQRDTGLLLHNGAEEECVWSARNPFRYHLVLPCPLIKVSVKLQQPNSRPRPFRNEG